MENFNKIEQFRESENFPVASLLVPRTARKSIIALYKFARSADEIADDFTIPKDERKLALKQLYNSLEHGKLSEMPYFARDFYRKCFEGRMNVKHGLALLDAFIQDTEKSRYESWDETLSYCRRSASTIGRLFLEATSNFKADIKASDDICAVLQLLNHLQDLKKDYINLNRIYFDKSLFQNPDQIDNDKETDSITAGKKEVLARLKAMLDSSAGLIRTIHGFRTRMEIATIFKVAERLMNKLEANDILASRVELTRFEKLKAALGGLFWAIRIAPIRIGAASTELAMKSRSSFLKPLLKLDKERRKAMLCFYAFCRLVDDAADDVIDKEAAQEKLNFWNDEVEKMYSADNLVFPINPVSQEMALYIKKYNIDKEYLLEIIRGQQMDIDGVTLRPTEEMLDLYCYRVASAVGLVSVQIFGYRQNRKDKIQKFAIYLGKALQITNIIRDVREDAGKSRIYIPLELLEKYGLADINPHAIFIDYAKYEIELEPALKDMSEIADNYYRRAMKILPRKEKKNMKAALLMMRVYQKYLEKMKERKFLFDRTEIVLSLREKLQIFYEPARKV